MVLQEATVIHLNSGAAMPRIGFGTWDLRGKACTSAVAEAISAGYRLIDTAIMYENEAETGEGVRESGLTRESLFLTTKLDGACNGYGKALSAIERSLQRMKLDYLDLVLIHEPYSHAAEMYRALTEAHAAGLIRSIGVSNFNRRRYDLFLSECGLIPAVNQIESHVFYAQLPFVRHMAETGTAAQAWGPLAQGKHEIFRNPLLCAIGERHGKTAAQVALRFLLQSGVAIVPKSADPIRMRQNLDVLDFALTDDELAALRELDEGRSLSDWTSRWA